MTFLQILVLAIVQGAAELLPVSSSAHVILAEKLLRLDPTAPELTFLLVMLHAGTMVAVFLHYGGRWRMRLDRRWVALLVLATGATGVLGLALKLGIERAILGGGPKAEVEQLFGNLPLIAGSLAAAGVLILVAGRRSAGDIPLAPGCALLVGCIQGLCLPFRGFSRSGATISTGLLAGLSRQAAEEFSFALAVLLTPPVIALELRRLHEAHAHFEASLLVPGLTGMALAFFSGTLALKLLSRVLEVGRFWYFGLYCLAFAGVVLGVHFALER